MDLSSDVPLTILQICYKYGVVIWRRQYLISFFFLQLMEIYKNNESPGGTNPKNISKKQARIVGFVLAARNDHERLGLNTDSDSTVGEIRKAYLKMCKLTHPDKNSAPGADEAFKTVHVAFIRLTKDRNIKDEYSNTKSFADVSSKQPRPAREPQPPPPGRPAAQSRCFNKDGRRNVHLFDRRPPGAAVPTVRRRRNEPPTPPPPSDVGAADAIFIFFFLIFCERGKLLVIIYLIFKFLIRTQIQSIPRERSRSPSKRDHPSSNL
jgi:hypothetical protein